MIKNIFKSVKQIFCFHSFFTVIVTDVLGPKHIKIRTRVCLKCGKVITKSDV